jgi:DNA-3-methyladenine glycosylase II
MHPQLHTVVVSLPGPLDIPASLDVFRRWGDDGIDRWNGQMLLRTTCVEGQIVPFACTATGTVDEPAVAVTVAQAAQLPAIVSVIRTMFVTAPKPLEALVATDPVIARLESRYRGVRPVLQSQLFTALIRSISAQQVNLKWAATVRRRLAEAYGQRYTLGEYQVISLAAERIAAARVSELRALQFTTRKSEYIIALACAVAEGRLDLEALRHTTDAEVIARLTGLRGLGLWTAEWFLARALGRARVAAGDLGVRKAVGAVYLQGQMPTEAQVRELTAHWGEAAGVAQQLVLHALGFGV